MMTVANVVLGSLSFVGFFALAATLNVNGKLTGAPELYLFGFAAGGFTVYLFYLF